jgi:predicted acyl esterase
VTMGGYQQLVRGNPLRGKFRNSFEKPEPFVPGKVEALSWQIGDVNHTFRRGHRIMVQVQSSWFPLVDLNPQTFVLDSGRRSRRISRRRPSACITRRRPIPASKCRSCPRCASPDGRAIAFGRGC